MEALVTMQENLARDLFTPDREFERICHQCDVGLPSCQMSNDEPIEKVLDRGEIGLALLP